MGLVDIITALGKVTAERMAPDSLDYAAIDTGTGRPMAGDTRPLPPAGGAGVGGFLTDVLRQSQGQTTTGDANKIGLPEAAGLDREQIAQMLQIQKQPAQVQLLKAQAVDEMASAEQRRAKAKQMARYDAMRQDPDYASAQVSLLDKINHNPIMALQSQNPDTYKEMLANELDAVKAVKGGKAQTTATKKKAGTVPGQGGGGKPAPQTSAAGAKYISFAQNAKGEKIGYNAASKQWEPVSN